MKRIWPVISVYLGWRLWLLASASIATLIIPLVSTFTPKDNFGFHLPRLAWMWGNFDGVVFMNVAESGYTKSEVPFFPLFPLTMAIGGRLGFPILLAGLFVSTVALLGGLYFSWRLLQLEKKTALFWLVFLVLLSWPTAYHLSAVYSDSLFFFLATATLFFTRSKQYFLAGVMGALATFCRLNGLGLFFVLLVEYLFEGLSPSQAWQWREWGRVAKDALSPTRLLTSRVWFAAFIPLAFVAYLGYIHMRFGDWQLFFKGVEVWHRSQFTFPLQTFWRYFKILFFSPRITFTYWVAVGEAFFTAIYLAVLTFSWKRIHPTYWVMMFFHWLIPVITGTLQGMPRYGLHMFPLFFALALLLEKKPRWMQALYFALSLVLQLVYLAYFTSGYFVS